MTGALGTNRLMTCGGGKTSRGVHTLDKCGSWAGRYIPWLPPATTVHADMQWYGSHAVRHVSDGLTPCPPCCGHDPTDVQ